MQKTQPSDTTLVEQLGKSILAQGFEERCSLWGRPPKPQRLDGYLGDSDVSIFEKSGQIATPLSEGQRSLDLFTDRNDLVRLFCERLHGEPTAERISVLSWRWGQRQVIAPSLPANSCLQAFAYRRVAASVLPRL